MRIVSESEFHSLLVFSLRYHMGLNGSTWKSVTGPGRSGAIASVYASHYLGIPWFPSGQSVPEKLLPVLVIDTAEQTGATLRKAGRQTEAPDNLRTEIALFHEPPRVKFWYEA